MRGPRFDIFLIGLVFMIFLQPVAANERCDGLAPDAKDRVASQLDEAEMALDLGDLELANQRLYNAGRPSAVVDIALDQECMGTELRQRFYRVQQRIKLASGKNAETEGGRSAFASAVGFYIEGDNRADVTRLLNNLPQDPRAASTMGNRLRWKLDRLQYSIDKGHGLIAEEKDAPAFYRDTLAALIERSKSEANALLKRENDIVTGPVTEQESQLSSVQENVRVLQNSIVGDESLSAEIDKDMLIATSRAGQSQETLSIARRWLDWIDPDAGAPANGRAVLRGDALMKRANDADSNLESRDVFYEDAINYYRFAGAKQKLSAAEQSKQAIQPALQAARDTREQRMEEKLNELQKSAEEFKKSTEMSAEEKEVFKSEADALEAELGF